MRVESWVFYLLCGFFAAITPIYWFMSHDYTGTTALILAFFLTLMVGLYLWLIARRMDLRPEDKKLGEIAEGAGELGFFPPSSIWPLYCAVAMALVVLGPVYGWWLSILGFAFGAVALCGLVFQYYRHEHAH